MKPIFDFEQHLSQQQVYVRTEIVNEDFDVIMHAGRVYDFGKVEVTRVNQSTVITRIESERGDIKIVDDGVTDIGYHLLTERRFIPVSEMVKNYLLNR